MSLRNTAATRFGRFLCEFCGMKGSGEAIRLHHRDDCVIRKLNVMEALHFSIAANRDENVILRCNDCEFEGNYQKLEMHLNKCQKRLNNLIKAVLSTNWNCSATKYACLVELLMCFKPLTRGEGNQEAVKVLVAAVPKAGDNAS